MKRLIIIFLAFFFVGAANAQTLNYSHSFNMPVIKTDKNTGYSNIIYENCKTLGDEGTPLIPYYAVDLLLPQNKEIENIKILDIEFYNYQADVKLKPRGKYVPISKDYVDYTPNPDENIYNSDDIYPSKKVDNSSTQFLAGHSIGSFTICPIQYIPAKNNVKFVKKINLEITLKDIDKSNELNKFLRNNKTINKRINKIVENPQVLKYYNYPKDFSEYDILLITDNSLLSAFQDYIDFKISTGFIVATETVDDIYSNYSGADDQEKIRNCIIDYYQNYGINYVILGGDADPSSPVIPSRGFYASAGATTDDNIPSDMYYCCLDGTWNDDNDGKWGESGETDLYAEVSIGRICVDNTTEVENATNKLYMYQNEPVIDDIEKALMVGEELWTGIYGKMYKTQIETGGTFNGYTTVGFPDNFSIEQLYQQDGNWSHSQLYSQFNSTGINLLNHLGHSNVTYNMTIYNPDVNSTNFQNDGITRGYVIEYSQGCYCGSFDNRDDAGGFGSTDCFSEKITGGFENGNVAMIANSRYGWGDNTGTDGASQYYDREFFDALFGENITEIGIANNDSKEDNAAYFNSQSVMRWCAYELTLFGDPSMDIWTEIPTDISANYSSSVSVGTSQINFITDAPYARVALMQNDVLIGRAVADETGNVTVNLFEAVSSPNQISVSIIAHNKNRHLGDIVVVTDQPYVVYSSSSINDDNGNGNGLPDYGEDINLSVELENVGTVGANDVNVTLTASDQYITITDSTENFGNFNPGQLKEIIDAFAYSISDQIPDQHSVIFTITATSATDEWESNFSVDINAPVPYCEYDNLDDNGAQLVFNSTPITKIDQGVYYNYNIDVQSTSGNSNGILDPGETVIINAEAFNNGHADFYNVSCDLTCNNSYVTVNSSSVDLGTIEAQESKIAPFSISIDQNAPLGENIQLIFTLSGGQYSFQDTSNISVGLISEDFETGDFSSFDWNTADWIITTDDVYEGNYASKSNIEGQSSTTAYIEITLNDVPADSEISFCSKVSSETDYDFLKFYIDGIEEDQWSGQGSWEENTYNLDAGNHTLKWAYEKDVYVDDYSDCAWLDYIIFPPFSSKTVKKGIVITAPTKPNWLNFEDYGDGTAALYGQAPNQFGLYDVILHAQSSDKNEAQQEFSIQVGEQTIVDELIKKIKFYPNPVSEVLNIEMPFINNKTELEIADIAGKIIYKTDINSKITSVDLSNEANGVYIVKILIDEKVITKKIMLE